MKTTYVPALCNHCADAPCVTVCPTGASHQRDDGIVLVDQDKCIGCRACMMACPYANRFYLRKGVLETGYHGERTAFEDAKWQSFTEGTVTKCTFCAHRVDDGLEPACVVTCPTDARIFGDLDDPESRPSVLIRERDGAAAAAGAGHEPVRLLRGGEVAMVAAERLSDPAAPDRRQPVPDRLPAAARVGVADRHGVLPRQGRRRASS